MIIFIILLMLFGLHFGAGYGKAKPKQQPAKVTNQVTVYHVYTPRKGKKKTGKAGKGK